MKKNKHNIKSGSNIERSDERIKEKEGRKEKRIIKIRYK